MGLAWRKCFVLLDYVSHEHMFIFIVVSRDAVMLYCGLIYGYNVAVFSVDMLEYLLG